MTSVFGWSTCTSEAISNTGVYGGGWGGAALSQMLGQYVLPSQAGIGAPGPQFYNPREQVFVTQDGQRIRPGEPQRSMPPHERAVGEVRDWIRELYGVNVTAEQTKPVRPSQASIVEYLTEQSKRRKALREELAALEVEIDHCVESLAEGDASTSTEVRA